MYHSNEEGWIGTSANEVPKSVDLQFTGTLMKARMIGCSPEEATGYVPMQFSDSGLEWMPVRHASAGETMNYVSRNTKSQDHKLSVAGPKGPVTAILEIKCFGPFQCYFIRLISNSIEIFSGYLAGPSLPWLSTPLVQTDIQFHKYTE